MCRGDPAILVFAPFGSPAERVARAVVRAAQQVGKRAGGKAVLAAAQVERDRAIATGSRHAECVRSVAEESVGADADPGVTVTIDCLESLTPPNGATAAEDLGGADGHDGDLHGRGRRDSSLRRPGRGGRGLPQPRQGIEQAIVDQESVPDHVDVPGAPGRGVDLRWRLAAASAQPLIAR